MNAQEAARILAKENDSSVREFSRIHFKNSKEEKLYRPHIERRQAVS